MTEPELFRLILDQMKDGVLVLDDQDSVIYINPAARNIFDLEDNNNIVRRKVDAVVLNHDFINLITNRQNVPDLIQEISLDGNKVYITKCISIPEGGTVVTLQDITYLKQIEQEKNESISTISHDLRSPLTAITGYVDLLERVGPVNEKQKDFIHRVQKNVATAANMINELLEFGKTELMKTSSSDTVHLGRVLEEAIESNAILIEKKEINIACILPEKIPLIKGNPVKIRQMVDNLLGNALKYSPQKGEVKVSIKTESSQLIFQVSDNGPGIPVSDQPHIFKKYYRAGNTSGLIDGSGLGLSIVKTIVELHHGRIWVESSQNSGSTFTVVLPKIKNQ